jgi:superfamily I DNA/RNA helicase
VRHYLQALDKTRQDSPTWTLQHAVQAIFTTFFQEKDQKKKGKPDAAVETARTTLLKHALQLHDTLLSQQRPHTGHDAIQTLLAELSLSESEDAEDIEDDDRVIISTIHQAKGLEWPIVITPHFIQGLHPVQYRLPRFQQVNANTSKAEQAHYDEERRIAYVAFTRAKEQLCISHLTHYGGAKADMSTFLSDILVDHAHLVKKGTVSVMSFTPQETRANVQALGGFQKASQLARQ